MDNWEILKNELKYYGIILVNNRRCKVDLGEGLKEQGIIRTIRQINHTIRKKIELFSSLWEDAYRLLIEETGENKVENIIDYRVEKIFIFSLKDMIKCLLCFDENEIKKYKTILEKSLRKDINSFSKCQIHSLVEYKMSIDWVHRLISFFYYIKKLLLASLMGRDKFNDKVLNKVAKGIMGPWSRLDLPMEERVFPFGQELDQRKKTKMKQRRYRKGLQNYHTPEVGEGHYWREPRNEPFSWADRGFNDPYPGRNVLTGK